MGLTYGVKEELLSGGFDQIPNLSSSQQLDANAKFFSPVDGIDSNMNSSFGQQFRKKKHAKKKNLTNNGLGKMLACGAVGFLAADMMMGGDIVGGLMMGAAHGAMMAGDAAMYV